ncbi:MAG: hypothetical protein ACTIKR_04850 [Advenella sp.]|uniref:hypothetical protein n=1 Tax=Advenella sp. TaxID=1872388 RepID=UPI003F96B7DE
MKKALKVKERLDCALISIPGCETLAETLLKPDRLHNGRLHFSLVEPSPGADHGTFPSVSLLQEMTYSLRHFDAICLPVSSASLVWTRLLLQQTRIEQHRPIFVLGLSLRPIGLIDLLELGVVDFALWPCEPEEIRVRLLRALHELRNLQARLPSLLGDSVNTKQYAVHDAAITHPAEYALAPAPAPACAPAGTLHLTGERPGSPLLPAFKRSGGRTPAAALMGVSPGTDRILSPVSLLRGIGSPMPQGSKPAGAHPARLSVPKVCCQEIAQFPEGFQQLKSVVVTQFERAYLTHALARSKGNIALAARNSHKHRRAFWALMRKHQISAEPFRDNGF